MSVSNGDIVRAALRLTGPSSQSILNIWHFRADLDSTVDDATFASDFCTQMKNIYSALNTYQNSAYNVADIKIDVVSWVAGEEVVLHNVGTYAWPSGYEPASTENPLPPQVAALLKYGTTGVRTLAKKYIGGFTEAENGTSGLMTTTLYNALLGAFDAFLSGIVLSTGKSLTAVVHGKRANAWLPLVSLIVDAAWSTQRKRKAGVGV